MVAKGYSVRKAEPRDLAAVMQVEQVVLLVHEDWHKAIRIYEKQGFIRTQILDRFAWFGDRRAFIYEKTI